MRLSIRDMVHDQCRSFGTQFAHDRSNTVGASEIGQCIRKTWFAKHETPEDEDYDSLKGAAHRGSIIEDHWIVPAMRAGFDKLGAKILFEGDNQKSLVSGFLSATPDGLAQDVERGCLAHLGVEDCLSSEVAIEIKSIDPRYTGEFPKPEHVFQCQVQMGLFHECTNHRPYYALICYTDASFLDDVQEFVVKFDPEIMDVARSRALRIMDCATPEELMAEGKMAGGHECAYCPYKRQCSGTTVMHGPNIFEPKEINSGAEVNFDAAAAEFDRLKKDITAAEKAKSKIEESIKKMLRKADTRSGFTKAWKASWSTVKGRRTIDTEQLEFAAARAGIDVSPYVKVGSPSETLRITKIKQPDQKENRSK